MPAVVELRPKRGAWTDVVALFRAGDYSACLNASRGWDDGRARALRARAFLRLERIGEALHAVSQATADLPIALRGEHASLASIALISLRQLEEARERQRDARAYLFSVDEPALEIELHAFEARLSFAEGDVYRATAIANESLQINDRFVRRSDAICTSTARADLLNVLAVIQVSLGQRTRAVETMTTALDTLDASPFTDVGLTAKLLSNIAGSLDGSQLEVERSSIALVRDRYSTLCWTSDLANHHYLVVRELGWASALAGDHLNAFREFRKAFNLAPSPKHRLRALLDRVYLSRELEQHVLAHVDLLEAQELATSIDWSHGSDVETASLLPLAMLLAPIDLPAARGALNSYTLKKASAGRSSTAFTDERYHGEYLQAEAAIAHAEGRLSAANLLTAQAFEIYDRLGIRWRAAQAALALTTPNESMRYLEYARTEAKLRPRSWLATRVAATQEQSASAG